MPYSIDKYAIDGEIRRNDNLAVQKQVHHFIDDNMDRYGRICYSVDLHRSVLYAKWAGHSDEVLSLTGIEETSQFITVITCYNSTEFC